MYLYILIKIIFELIGLKFYARYIIYLKYIYFIFESFIIILFFIFLIKSDVPNFERYLFIWCLSWVSIFLIYKWMNFILKNFENIIKWIEKREKIKNFLLKPKINKIIYYFVWFLPWNIIYWIYFWLMENGWYFRVWFCSNRDIFFMKYFNWDSRNFFFKLNEFLFENFLIKFLNFIKDEIIRLLLRILIILFIFRRNLLKLNIFEFLFNRIFIFCYISLFFFYVFEQIQFFNSLVVIFIILLEILILLFIPYLFNIKMLQYFFNQMDIRIKFFLFDPLTLDYSIVSRLFFEVNNTVWNLILGESISLNILKEYMLWVNKNTKGYYFYSMNILPKYNIIKLYDLSSIPFDILPRTRYVIMNLRFINNNFFKNEIMLSLNFIIPDYRIRYMKNLYLSYFEKTYAVDSSLLSIIFLLRMNPPVNYMYLEPLYKDVIDEPFWKVVNYIMSIQKSALWRLRLAEINKANPELFDICYLLNSFKTKKQLYDIEYFFVTDFFYKDKKNKIPKIFENKSLSDYKRNIKLLAHFVLYEEEGIVWNEDNLNYLKKIVISLDKHKNLNNEYLFNLYELTKKLETFIFLKELEEFDFKNEIEEFFGLSFDKNIDLLKVLELDLQNIKFLKLKIVNINFFNDDISLYMHCLLIIKDLDELRINNLKFSRYSFLVDD